MNRVRRGCPGCWPAPSSSSRSSLAGVACRATRFLLSSWICSTGEAAR